MQIALPSEGLANYRSNSQRARIATEAWAFANLYCPNCTSPRLTSAPPNHPAIDYDCPKCKSPFQLKSQSAKFGARINDAAYSTMIRAILENRTPNLFALSYNADDWKVTDVLLIPQFAFPISAIEKRKPLSPTARRAGWVGCNILLHAIPPDARIAIVRAGKPRPPAEVRREYARLRPLATLDAKQRGWTLDVLNGIRSLGKKHFDLAEAYTLEAHLSHLHPANRHVQPKIRQQLQLLRDLGLIEFFGKGSYRLR
ncbi:MAG: DpnI domain-containing protein [Candidatus Acidiferrales bacterium]